MCARNFGCGLWGLSEKNQNCLKGLALGTSTITLGLECGGGCSYVGSANLSSGSCFPWSIETFHRGTCWNKCTLHQLRDNVIYSYTLRLIYSYILRLMSCGVERRAGAKPCHQLRVAHTELSVSPVWIFIVVDKTGEICRRDTITICDSQRGQHSFLNSEEYIWYWQFVV